MGRPEAAEPAPPAKADAAEAPAEAAPAEAAPSFDRAAGLQTEIDRLTAELDERRRAHAALRQALDRRDGAVAALTAALAARGAEIEGLRAELADLREQLAFDVQLAAMKLGGPAAPGVAAIPGEADAVEAALAAARPAPDAPDPDRGERPLTDIHFEFGSARLTPGGQTHAAVAAAMLSEMDLAAVRLVGYTDRVGSPAANRALAEKRARAVAEFLVATGLPESMVETTGMGEADAPVSTDDGVREPLNRCVTIVAIPLPTT